MYARNRLRAKTMSAIQEPSHEALTELFEDNFDDWLEKHGVSIGDWDDKQKNFEARIDLNMLKLGICLLVEAQKAVEDKQLRSDCHHAPVERYDSPAGHYFRCTVCNEPCDIEEVAS